MVTNCWKLFKRDMCSRCSLLDPIRTAYVYCVSYWLIISQLSPWPMWVCDVYTSAMHFMKISVKMIGFLLSTTDLFNKSLWSGPWIYSPIMKLRFPDPPEQRQDKSFKNNSQFEAFDLAYSEKNKYLSHRKTLLRYFRKISTYLPR